MRKGLSVNFKISFSVLLVSIFCSMLISGSSYLLFRNNLEKYMGVRARDVALAVSVNVDGNSIAAYDRTGTADHYLTTLIDYLSAIKASTGVTYLYVMVDAGDNYKYIAEGGTDEPAQLGDLQLKTEYGPEPASVLSTGQAEFSKMYDNGEFGNLLSGFAPITDSAGKVVGVVGLDIGTAIIEESIGGFLPVILAIMIGSCLLSYLLIFLVVSRLVVKPVRILEIVSGKLANSDFNISIPEKYLRKNDEIGRLAKAFTALAGNIKKIISDISRVLADMSDRNLDVCTRETYEGDFLPIKASVSTILATYNVLLADFEAVAENVSLSTRGLSENSNEMSSGLVIQAGAVETLLGAVEQISDNAGQNVVNVQHAKTYIADMDSDITLSNDQMTRLLTAMDEIKNSADSISKINKVIDDITFQTNILALNASIEAARAGAAGKGFAVVAGEVRELANKTAAAAKQTTALIDASLHAVKKGTTMAERAALALDDVQKKTHLMTQTVDNIASITDKQARAISEIKLGMNSISSVVITNSAKAQESAASSNDLSIQAQQLYDNLADFTLKQTGGSRVTNKPAAYLLLDD